MMPWEAKTVEESRRTFGERAEGEGENFSALCREYGINRSTGYTWLERYRSGEVLSDRSRRPFHTPRKTPEEVEQRILALRAERPAWGPRKLKRVLENRGHAMPAKSTVAEILRRNGCISKEESLKHTAFLRFERGQPNELWQADFKGDFLLGSGERCFPLTVLDDCSRFSLCIDAKANQQASGVFASFGRLFEEYGLPDELLCDNGNPWGNSQLTGYTGLEVWLLKLGIRPIHGRARHPQTQGKEERFHRTLVDEVLSLGIPENMLTAQTVFSGFREEYNHVRPHEALGLEVPASRYRPSARPYEPFRYEPDYPAEAVLRKVNSAGFFRFGGRAYFLSEAFANEVIAIVDAQQEDCKDILFSDFSVARIDLSERMIVSKKIRARRREEGVRGSDGL
jgi:transposase InsO family protein